MRRRRKARELMVQALYASEVGQKELGEALAEQIQRRASSEQMIEYAERVLQQVSAHRDDLDRRIDAVLVGWSPERVGVVERCILRIALAEFLHVPETPPKVALTEALELARTYSTDDAARFVNGVLDRLLEQAEA